MTRMFFTALAAAALLAAVPAAAQQVVPVTFAKGKSSATVTGSITGDQDRTYTVDARAGQKMTVTLKRTKGANTEMNIWAPDTAPGGADTALSAGAIDPYNVTTTLPANGRYRIQVYQMRASARRGETASYALTIAINGAAPKASTDALVPGTNYNATSIVRCGRDPGHLTSSCDAGIKRHGNGTASLYLTTPQNGRRTLQFRGTDVVASDGGLSFKVSRYGDVSIISVGPYEVYAINDALIVGG